MAFTLPNKPFLSLFVFSFLFALKYWGEVRAILKTQITHMKNDWYFRTTSLTRVTSVAVLVHAAVQQAVASCVVD